MPQKKNPSAHIEGVRNLGAKALADQVGILALLNALPYQHTAARQLLSAEFIDGVAQPSVRAMSGMVQTLTPKKERMLQNVAESYAMMAGLTDTIVKESGVSFPARRMTWSPTSCGGQLHGRPPRDRYQRHVVNSTAQKAWKGNLRLNAKTVNEALDPLGNVLGLTVIGGPAPDQVEKHIKQVAGEIEDARRAPEDAARGDLGSRSKLLEEEERKDRLEVTLQQRLAGSTARQCNHQAAPRNLIRRELRDAHRAKGAGHGPRRCGARAGGRPAQPGPTRGHSAAGKHDAAAQDRVTRLELRRTVMLIGVPKEIKTHEYRVGLIPARCASM